MLWLAPDRYEAEFAAETARLCVAVAEMKPHARVPTCPEWTVRDLVAHVGTGQLWASEIVEGRLSEPPPYGVVPAPADPATWPGWLGGGARRLAAAVRDAGLDRPVWTWRPERTAGFWLRKMLHDVLVHRFDTELACGRPGDVAPDVAADGISDLFSSIATLSRPDSPDPVFAGLAGSGGTLAWAAIDLIGASWLVERTPDGVTWRHGQATADVSVRAPVRDLLLVLNRRLDPAQVTDLKITGDHSLLTYWLDHSRF